MLYIARLFYISNHSLDVFTASQCIAVKEREMQSSMNHSSVGESDWIHENNWPRWQTLANETVNNKVKMMSILLGYAILYC
jgi:hypothetical protein